MTPKVVSPVRTSLAGLLAGVCCFSCAHTLSEQPNTPEVAHPVQHTNDPISQTVDVAVDDRGDVAVKKNDRKEALGQKQAAPEPIANPLDPTAPAPATVPEPITVPQQ